jgi:hypothetical protein
MSTTYDLDKSENLDNYDWMQPMEENPQLHRSDRRTVYNRRNVKATED